MTSAQQAITNPGFEQLDAAGWAVDWEPVGESVSVGCDEPCTNHYLRLYRDEATVTPETGFNRRWQPDSGEQGALLSQTRGAIKFRYRAIWASDATLNIFVIPMSERPWEDTGERRAQFLVPESHIGDQEWHEGALKYDFTAEPKVKWVHVSGRIIGGAGELWVDDFRYVERLGPLLRVESLEIEEIAGSKGERFRLVATIANAGDEAATGAEVIAAKQAMAMVVGNARKAVPTLEPDETCEVAWEMKAPRRDGQRLDLELLTAGGRLEPAALTLRAELSRPEIEVERAVLAPGERTTLRWQVTNVGSVPVSGARAVIDCDRGLSVVGGKRRQTIARINPGETAAMTWTLKAEEQTPRVTASVRVEGDVKTPIAQAELLVAPRPPTRDLSGVGVEEDLAWVAGGGWRVLFPRAEYGFGVGYVQVERGKAWQTVAVMPRLALVHAAGSGAEAGMKHEAVVHLAYGEPYVVRGTTLVGPEGVMLHEEHLAFEAPFTDPAGGDWELAVGLKAVADDLIAANYSLECDLPRKLFDFQGPTLWIGEGGESARSDAIFPGLEWLVGDEVSSSTLDIEAGHPDRDRHHPHPHKITVPAMGVRLESGAAVGLLWYPEERWDGVHDRPSTTFASPARSAGRASHTIGLFLPSIPDYLREATLSPGTVCRLDAHREVTLSAMIMIQPEAPDSLVVVDRWYQLNGPPDPAPLPRGDYASEVAFSMRAYLESLWVEEEQQWWTSVGGGPLLSRKARPPAFWYDLTMGAALSSDAEIARRCRALAERMIALTGNQPANEELGLAFGGGCDQHLARAAGRAANLIAAQWADGSWRFDADHVPSGVFKGKDYHELGPDDAAEVGTCARNAYTLLRYLRITGDESAREPARRALEFMNQFRVPRAAQVWEVPVHTPDVLAAADAVEAYLEGYLIFGDAAYLERAKYWARAGLPFIYVWGRPEHPYMLYGSIPVFGATWFRGSWFGRLVQWNGLRYSYALLKLAEYDQDFPWRTIAEGIVRSAIHQQATDDEHVALWPDNIGLITGDRCPWIFTPQLILKNVYALLGLHPEAEIRQDGGVRIVAAARIADVKSMPGHINCIISEPHVGVGYVLVAGVAEPTAATRIAVDGVALELRDDLEASGEPGWRYDEQGLLLIAPPRGREQVNLLIQGHEPRSVSLLPDQRKELRFEFDRGREGWLAEHHVEGLAAAQGRLRGAITGGDPYLVRRNLAVEGDGCAALAIRMRVTGGALGQVYWTTETSPDFAEDKVVKFDLQADGEFHQYEFAVGKHALWRGQKITGLRIDPNNGAPGTEFEIHWIRCR